MLDAKQTRPSPVLERVWLRETKRRLHTHLGMPSKLASTASWPQISRPVVQQEQTSSPLWPRPWAVLLRTLSTQFGPSAVPSPTGLVPLTLPSLRGILFGRFAIALWRGNASLWLHRHQTLPRGSLAVFFISCTFSILLLLFIDKEQCAHTRKYYPCDLEAG